VIFSVRAIVARLASVGFASPDSKLDAALAASKAGRIKHYGEHRQIAHVLEISLSESFRGLNGVDRTLRLNGAWCPKGGPCSIQFLEHRPFAESEEEQHYDVENRDKHR
jgi:hypothetical protein